MDKFQHILLTRMNVDWNLSRTRSQQERNDVDFLNYRFEVFEKTCLPSVNAQTNKDFIWIILLDEETPEIFRERIQAYQTSLQILPIYIKSKETLLATLKETILEQLLESTTHLITTNLDSDDVISKRFISSIQDQFRSQDFEFINFPFGYLYQSKEQKLYLREWLTAACHTLIEKRENFETALKYPHNEISSYKVRQVITTPMWLMTVHDMNVRTRFDVSAAWQPIHRLKDDFCTNIDFPKRTILGRYQELFSEMVNLLVSKREWDTPKVKFRKALNILSPSLIRSNRMRRYHG